MPPEDQASSISRRQLIRRGAVVGSTAIWAPPLVQSLRLPAHAQVGSPGPLTCIVDGYMIGGGHAFDPNGIQVDYSLRRLDCPPLATAPDLIVTWSVGQRTSRIDYIFELTAYTSRLCTDNPGIVNGPHANFDTAVGTGTGTLRKNGVPQAGSIEFGFVDGGDGNAGADVITLIIRDAANNVVVNIANKPVFAGDTEAHLGNIATGRACL